MKKMTIVVLGVLLALSLVGTRFAAVAPAAGQVQAACPVMGGKPDPRLFADYQGQRVYFCCPACLELFKKDPEKYLQKLQKQPATPSQGATGK